MEFTSNKAIFPDYKSGPLSAYRSKSSFDSKKLKLIIEDQATLELRQKVWNFMETNTEFSRNNRVLSLDEMRQIATRRMFVIFNEKFYDLEQFLERPDLAGKYVSALCAYDASFAVKTSLAFGMFPTTIRTMGTERLQSVVDENQLMKNVGCFALTEISHGTNVKRMRLEARYDINTGNIVLNSPDFEAAKCWVGNLGKTATHAVVYAQLYDVAGEHHGLNAFLVPIRDTKTLHAFPGVSVGDMGHKIGLNGIDNGFVMFNHYHIPRENLLSRSGDITADGKFVTQIKDKNKRFGSSLFALSGGRINICEIAATYVTKALTIAIRYSAARKQFGPEDSDIEFPVIEYQAQQYRLLPHLATTFAVKIFSTWLSKTNGDMSLNMLMGQSNPNAGMEIHALSSAAKPVVTWLVRDAIQECRESCGGHGYLKIAGFGELANDHGANVTYEGENNVLIQQASNWLLGLRGKNHENFGTNSPLKTASFFKDAKEISKKRFTWKKPECALRPENLLIALNWICVYYLEQTYKRVEELKKEGKTLFNTRNDSQVFAANNLAIAYGNRTIFNAFYERTQELAAGPEKEVLVKLLSLFGANLIVKNYLGCLYQGFIVQDPNSTHTAADLYEKGILNLLPVLKDEAVGLIDSIAFPDFITDSPLGMSDGDIYKNLQQAIFQGPGVFERPEWYQDVIQFKSYVKSKL